MSDPELLAPVFATRRDRRAAERAAEAAGLAAGTAEPTAFVASSRPSAQADLAPQPDPMPHARPVPRVHPAPRPDPAPRSDPAPHAAPAPSPDFDSVVPRWLAAGSTADTESTEVAVPVMTRSGGRRGPAEQHRPIARPRLGPSRRASALAKAVISTSAMLSVVGLAVGLSVPAAATFGSPSPLESSAESLSPAGVQPALSAARAGQTTSFGLTSGSAAMDLGSAAASARAETTFVGESKAEVLRALYLAAGRPFEPGFIPTTGSVRWPFPTSTEVSSGFGERDMGFHGGTDFVPGYGAPVGAIADGVVTWVGRDRTNLGYYVTIAHVIDGVRVDSLYAHLVDDSSAGYGLYPGMAVAVGALIGDTGNTGFSTGPHLHLEIHLEGVQVNPFEWLTINAR